MNKEFVFTSGSARDMVVQMARERLWHIGCSGNVCTDALKYPHKSIQEAVDACVEDTWVDERVYAMESD